MHDCCYCGLLGHWDLHVWICGTHDLTLTLQVHSTAPVYINGEELPPTTWYPIYRYTKGAVYSPSEAKLGSTYRTETTRPMC
jgi:hypothetical protein